MSQTKAGALKRAAHQIGIPLNEYILKMQSGLKRCSSCKSWKSIAAFYRDVTRYDGIATKCIICTKVKQRKQRIPMEDIRFVQRAHDAIRYAIKRGEIKKPTAYACRCGKPAMQYHHHSGYKGHELDVVPLCISCHRKDHYGNAE